MKYKQNKTEDDLLDNPHIKKQLNNIGKGNGEAGRFMIKVREGKVSLNEIREWIKKDFKKTLKWLKETS